MARQLKYPFDKLTSDGKSVTIPAYNYKRRHSIRVAAAEYAKRNSFTITTIAGSGEITITRLAA